MEKCKKGLSIFSSMVLCSALLLCSRSVAAEEGSLQASVNVLASELTAETSIVEALDTDGVVVIEVKIDRIKDPSTGDTTDIPGGIASYTATVTADLSGTAELLAVRGVAPFDNLHFNTTTGEFYATSSYPAQPDNTVVAKLVVRLTGDADVPCNITVTFQEIIASDPPNVNVPQEAPGSLGFLRGDANGDSSLNIFDAMYISQYIVGIRPIEDLRLLNAASVNYGGADGDTLNIFDAMYIAQYVVGLRNANFE